MNAQQVADLIVDEDFGFEVFHILERKFGWAGTFMTRADAENYAEGGRFTDQEWEELRNRKGWRAHIGEVVADVAFGRIAMEVHDFYAENDRQEAI